MTETVEQVAKALTERALAEKIAELRCSWCAYDAFPQEPAVVQMLVEHCLYEHGSHVPIISVKFDEFVEGYALAHRVGAPALTDAEEMWRALQ